MTQVYVWLQSVITAQDAEREKLKAELQAAQEQVTALMADPSSTPQVHSGAPTYSPTHRSPSNSISHGDSRPNSYISVTSSTSETTDTAQDTDSQPLPSGDDSCEL